MITTVVCQSKKNKKPVPIMISILQLNKGVIRCPPQKNTNPNSTITCASQWGPTQSNKATQNTKKPPTERRKKTQTPPENDLKKTIEKTTEYPPEKNHRTTKKPTKTKI